MSIFAMSFTIFRGLPGPEIVGREEEEEGEAGGGGGGDGSRRRLAPAQGAQEGQDGPTHARSAIAVSRVPHACVPLGLKLLSRPSER